MLVFFIFVHSTMDCSDKASIEHIKTNLKLLQAEKIYTQLKNLPTDHIDFKMHTELNKLPPAKRAYYQLSLSRIQETHVRTFTPLNTSNASANDQRITEADIDFRSMIIKFHAFGEKIKNNQNY